MENPSATMTAPYVFSRFHNQRQHSRFHCKANDEAAVETNKAEIVPPGKHGDASSTATRGAAESLHGKKRKIDDRDSLRKYVLFSQARKYVLVASSAVAPSIAQSDVESPRLKRQRMNRDSLRTQALQSQVLLSLVQKYGEAPSTDCWAD